MTYKIPILIRKYQKDNDEKFIYNSYLKSQRNYFDPVSNLIYYKEQPKVLDRLIHLFGVKVACNPEFPEQLYGWISFEDSKDVLHFAYTKESFRRLDIFTRLLDSYESSSKVILVSHYGKMLFKSKKHNFVFYPYALYYGMTV